jgi:hypothetical protein
MEFLYLPEMHLYQRGGGTLLGATLAPELESRLMLRFRASTDDMETVPAGPVVPSLFKFEELMSFVPVPTELG